MALRSRDLTYQQMLEAPYSLDPLPGNIRSGLVVIGIFAVLSVISTFMLLSWITWRMLSWRKHYRSYVGYNQYVLLIYQLLLADLQQAISFLFSFHWIGLNKIVGPEPACFAQAWFLHIGDVASGFFVLAIAAHTWISVVRGRKIPFPWFVGVICGIWAAAVLLTIIGPLEHGPHFFLRAGSWCWIAPNHETSRLTLHYIWIFIDEFGTVVIYALIFLHLRKQLSSIIHVKGAGGGNNAVSQAARYMIVYPMVYVILTLPLAAGRMAAMSGHTFSDDYYLVAGALMTSCGWLDTLLYTLTRRVLVGGELTGTKSQSRSRDLNSGWEIQSFDGDADKKTRNVTITGGRRTRGSIIGTSKDAPRGRTADGKYGDRRGSSISLREPSPVGSTDNIISKGMSFGNIKAETKVEVTIQKAESQSSLSDLTGKDTPSSIQPGVRFQNWGSP